jgi:hypothetical protein
MVLKHGNRSSCLFFCVRLLLRQKRCLLYPDRTNEAGMAWEKAGQRSEAFNYEHHFLSFFSGFEVDYWDM